MGALEELDSASIVMDFDDIDPLDILSKVGLSNFEYQKLIDADFFNSFPDSLYDFDID